MHSWVYNGRLWDSSRHWIWPTEKVSSEKDSMAQRDRNWALLCDKERDWDDVMSYYFHFHACPFICPANFHPFPSNFHPCLHPMSIKNGTWSDHQIWPISSSAPKVRGAFLPLSSGALAKPLMMTSSPGLGENPTNIRGAHEPWPRKRSKTWNFTWLSYEYIHMYVYIYIYMNIYEYIWMYYVYIYIYMITSFPRIGI